jgi:hypothetical protein
MEYILDAAVVVVVAGIASFLWARRGRRAEGAPAWLEPGTGAGADLRSVTRRIQEILEPIGWPVGSEKSGRAYSLDVGGRAAFFLEVAHDVPTTNVFAMVAGLRAANQEQRAYVVLGSGAPEFTAAPKGVFGKPGVPVVLAEDRAFARAFWVEGSDERAIRRYLGPELRRFLLDQESPWRLHARPAGVAVVREGRMRTPDQAQVTKTLERLVMAVEAAERGRH